MYEPPIQLNFGDVGAIEQMKSDIEDAITYRVQMALSVDVDKDELLRALKYDRDQYFKGYKDGKRDAQNAELSAFTTAMDYPRVSELLKRWEEFLAENY